MQAKIKKRIIAILMFTIVMIYLSISASAVATFDSASYFIAFRDSYSPGKWTNCTTGAYPYTLTNSYSTINDHVYMGYKTNQIITDGSIIVATIKIDNIQAINLLGAGKPTSDTTFSKTGITYEKMMAIPLSQEIIASTSIQLGTSIQHTTTFRAKGYTSQNVVVGYTLGAPGASTTPAITLVNCDLYESVQEAASSGTTPEEMRDVLSQWSETELMPGIQDAVEGGVQSGMEAALEDEKQQANTDGNSAIDELTSALDGVVSDINQAKESFETLGSALQYSGTSASLTFPGMNVPFLGQISEPINFDITGYIDSTFPPQLLMLIRCALSIGIVSYPIFELVKQLRKLLDKG